MFRSFTVLLLLAPAFAQAEAAECPADRFLPAGNVTESRFFAAPVKRVHEVVADAMQAVGVLLFEDTETQVRGERRPSRVSDMGLPHGNEAVAAQIQPAQQDGVRGATVTVLTRRAGSKAGVPKQSWSATVLDEAGCLLGLLSLEAPAARVSKAGDTASGTEGREVLLPRGTPVSLLIRRFLFSTDLRVNQRVAMEVASDVRVGERIVIPRGAYAAARITSAKDKTTGDFGRGAQATMAIEYVSAAGGERVAVSAPGQYIGGKAVRVKRLVWDPWGEGFVSGKSFGLRAGTAIEVVTAADEKIRALDGPTP